MIYVYAGKSKTDQGRKGHTIVIGAARLYPNICPILWFNTYTGMRPKNATKFFCKPNGERLPTTELNKILKKLLKSRPEVDASLYGSHSLRKEGCSKAAAAGVILTPPSSATETGKVTQSSSTSRTSWWSASR
jgi:hypothetical protein